MSDEQFKVIAAALCGTGSPEQMTAEAHRARESEKAALDLLEKAPGGLHPADDTRPCLCGGCEFERARRDLLQKAGRR